MSAARRELGIDASSIPEAYKGTARLIVGLAVGVGTGLGMQRALPTFQSPLIGQVAAWSAATRALAQTTDELAVAGADTATLLARQARLQAAVAKLVREIDEIRAVGGQALETAEANLKAAQQAYDTLLAEATATGTAPSARVAALRTPALVAARKALAEAKRAAALATDEAGAQWLRNGKRIDPPEAGTTPTGTGTTPTQLNVLTNTSCFPAGTMLLTPSGSKPIEAFRPGDLILSRPEHEPHHAPQPKAVEALFRRMALTLRLTVSGQTIETTGEHPFHVVGKGWRMARELVVGDVLESHNDQRGIVERLEATRRVVPVYNLRVADYHTYFVGCDKWGFSVWAHNAEYDWFAHDGVVYLRNAEGQLIRTGYTEANVVAQMEGVVLNRIQTPNGFTAPLAGYKFEAQGMSYTSEVTANADGSTSILHYITTKDGGRHMVGLSDISSEGQLTNAFGVPDELQRLDISRRMYAEARRIGYRSTAGAYHPASVNYKEFYKVYDPQKGNAVEALYQTPAGKLAMESSMKPTAIKIGSDKIEVVWVKE